MKRISIVYLLIVVVCTASLIAQGRAPQYQPIDRQDIQENTLEVTTAIHEQRIGALERQQASTNTAVEAMRGHVDDMTGKINEFTGIGIGVGVTLTVLQALQILIQFKRKEKPL